MNKADRSLGDLARFLARFHVELDGAAERCRQEAYRVDFLTRRVADARRIIEQMVDMLTDDPPFSPEAPELLSNWRGVRAWIEELDEPDGQPDGDALDGGLPQPLKEVRP